MFLHKIICCLKVFENRRKLNESRNRHKGVSIHPDQSKEERQQRSNLKLIIDSVKSGNCNDLQLRGSRVVREQGQPGENKDSRNEHRGGAFESRDRSYRYRSPTRERNGRNDRDLNRMLPPPPPPPPEARTDLQQTVIYQVTIREVIEDVTEVTKTETEDR